jgi:bilin biosynthesis protein
MSHAIGNESRSEYRSISISPEETDALLLEVNAQLQDGIFDPQNAPVMEQLIESLGDTRGMVRLRCAETLGEIGKPATPFLVAALANHSHVVVRRAAAKTLTLIADTTAIPTLINSLLNDDDTVVKGSSVGALARMGEAAVPVLLDILASGDHPESTIGHAAWALAFIGTEAKELVYRQIDSNSAVVRSAVVGAIASIAQEHPEEQAFTVLTNALADTDANVRSEAASALGTLAHQPAIPQLLELLNHPDGDSRKAAALALMKIGNPGVLALLKSAWEREPDVVIQGVMKLAISQLEKQVEDDDWDG